MTIVDIFAFAIRHVGDDELYAIEDTVYINVDQICSIKPPVFLKDMMDILTADGVMYRVPATDPVLVELLKKNKTDAFRIQDNSYAAANFRPSNENKPEENTGT